jgi:hypothetical protein
MTEDNLARIRRIGRPLLSPDGHRLTDKEILDLPPGTVAGLEMRSAYGQMMMQQALDITKSLNDLEHAIAQTKVGPEERKNGQPKEALICPCDDEVQAVATYPDTNLMVTPRSTGRTGRPLTVIDCLEVMTGCGFLLVGNLFAYEMGFWSMPGLGTSLVAWTLFAVVRWGLWRR